jgi:VanZ family protein
VRRTTQTWLAWLIALGWGAFIWNLGSDEFSMSSTSRILGPLLSWLSPESTAVQRQEALVAIRKLAHVAEYALFALLVARAIAIAFSARTRTVFAGTLLAVTALAAADEFRQAWSQLRTGSPTDVALDVTGGLLALAALYLLRRWLGRPMFDAGAQSEA